MNLCKQLNYPCKLFFARLKPTNSKICIMALQVLALKIAGSYLYRND
ncbi:MAG: hypothetical protein SPJ83_04100 [Helicobacter sp.]|nr:hypothetical protein [Helicobacter sp.]MDY5821967.1 hypothetical protein [Helicobacter sp.]